MAGATGTFPLKQQSPQWHCLFQAKSDSTSREWGGGGGGAAAGLPLSSQSKPPVRRRAAAAVAADGAGVTGTCPLKQQSPR